MCAMSGRKVTSRVKSVTLLESTIIPAQQNGNWIITDWRHKRINIMCAMSGRKVTSRVKSVTLLESTIIPAQQNGNWIITDWRHKRININ